MADETATPRPAFDLRVKEAAAEMARCLATAKVDSMEVHLTCNCGCGMHHVVTVARVADTAPATAAPAKRAH